MVEPSFKELKALEIETVTEMEKRLRRLLFRDIKLPFKSFNVMYLKVRFHTRPPQSFVRLCIVHLEGFRVSDGPFLSKTSTRRLAVVVSNLAANLGRLQRTGSRSTASAEMAAV
jgi:hypothetical protein